MGMWTMMQQQGSLVISFLEAQDHSGEHVLRFEDSETDNRLELMFCVCDACSGNVVQALRGTADKLEAEIAKRNHGASGHN